MSSCITHLKICGNIKYLPVSIKNLTKLEELDISSNRLSKFPNQILELSNLKVLNLRANNLDDLPDSISNLTKLEYLNLEGNVITKIPDGIGKLANLRELNIQMNQNSSLPESMIYIDNLEKIDIYANSICSLPNNISHWLDSMVLKSSQNSVATWLASQCSICPSGQVLCGDATIPRKDNSIKFECNTLDNASSIFDIRGKRIRMNMYNRSINSLAKGCYIIKYKNSPTLPIKRIVVP